MLLLIALVFTVNASASVYSGNSSSINTSACYNFKWEHPDTPTADRCFDIRTLYTNGGGFDPKVWGYSTSTVNDHSGTYMAVAVDVFGVPANEPEVEFNYKRLTPVQYDYLINYESAPAIINGKRYWYQINTTISSGYLKVRRPNSSVIDYADQIYVK